ncbi:unnamed protein product [Darwinula stevensoni]|uniref:Histone deacetylase complex subunit SAP130 C-terminal domain-containing protein n=1 Tax=Darwinula stevensoni TaxID=69355 RepID=A0A7R9FQS7_9CRUS|nr:unnamed protein product [Darwinula stevensoni]CAG0899987.1 unnamed protein product [Darwinula stevensoni]
MEGEKLVGKTSKVGGDKSPSQAQFLPIDLAQKTKSGSTETKTVPVRPVTIQERSAKALSSLGVGAGLQQKSASNVDIKASSTASMPTASNSNVKPITVALGTPAVSGGATLTRTVQAHVIPMTVPLGSIRPLTVTTMAASASTPASSSTTTAVSKETVGFHIPVMGPQGQTTAAILTPAQVSAFHLPKGPAAVANMALAKTAFATAAQPRAGMTPIIAAMQSPSGAPPPGAILTSTTSPRWAAPFAPKVGISFRASTTQAAAAPGITLVPAPSLTTSANVQIGEKLTTAGQTGGSTTTSAATVVLTSRVDRHHPPVLTVTTTNTVTLATATLAKVTSSPMGVPSQAIKFGISPAIPVGGGTSISVKNVTSSVATGIANPPTAHQASSKAGPKVITQPVHVLSSVTRGHHPSSVSSEPLPLTVKTRPMSIGMQIAGKPPPLSGVMAPVQLGKAFVSGSSSSHGQAGRASALSGIPAHPEASPLPPPGTEVLASIPKALAKEHEVKVEPGVPHTFSLPPESGEEGSQTPPPLGQVTTPKITSMSPRPSILRKREPDSPSNARRALNLGALPPSTPPLPPLSPHPDNVSSGGSSTISATSSPGMSEPVTPVEELIKQEQPEGMNMSQVESMPLSPRKKPRKQQLQGTELREGPQSPPVLHLESDQDSATSDAMEGEEEEEEEEEDEGERRQRGRGEVKEEEEGEEEEEETETIVKKPRLSLRANDAITWKPRHHHFVRFTDVKIREDKRPSVQELSNERNIQQKLRGWKLFLLQAQIEDLLEEEKEYEERLGRVMESFLRGRPSRDSKQETIIELFRANLQRCKGSQDLLLEAQLKMMKILDHRPHLEEIITKYSSKRNAQKSRPKIS